MAHPLVCLRLSLRFHRCSAREGGRAHSIYCTIIGWITDAAIGQPGAWRHRMPALITHCSHAQHWVNQSCYKSLLCYVIMHRQPYLNSMSHTVYNYESESKHIHISIKFNLRCMQPSCVSMSSRIFKSQILCVLDWRYLINKWLYHIILCGAVFFGCSL